MASKKEPVPQENKYKIPMQIQRQIQNTNKKQEGVVERNTEIQIQKYKYRYTNTEIQIQKYKIQVQIRSSKPPVPQEKEKWREAAQRDSPLPRGSRHQAPPEPAKKTFISFNIYTKFIHSYETKHHQSLQRRFSIFSTFIFIFIQYQASPALAKYFELSH